MKKFFIGLCIILNLFILINTKISVNAITDDVDELNKEVIELLEKTKTDYNYNCLSTFDCSDVLQELYWKIDTSCRDYMTNYAIELPGSIPIEIPEAIADKTFDSDEFQKLNSQMNMVIYAYKRDNPMIYFIHNSRLSIFSSSENGQNYINAILLSIDTRNGSGQERYNRNKILCNKIKEYGSYVDGIDSPYTKAMIFANLISKNMYYLYDDNGEFSQEEFAHNLVGLFVYGKGVCETYAYAFSALLNYVGVDCIYVNGKPDNGVGHAWNIVKLNDEQWYWFDLTNADNDKTGYIDGQYLGFDDELFNKYYKLRDDYLGDYLWSYLTAPSRGDNLSSINDWYTINLNGVLYQIFYNKARVIENYSNQELPETIELIIGTFTTECLHSNVISKDNCSYCLNCLNMLHKVAHDKAVQETCTEDGLTKGKHCSVCNVIIEEQVVIPKKGHTESEWIVVSEPTKTEEGYRYKECLECFEIIYEETLPKLNSNYTVIIIISIVTFVVIFGMTCLIIVKKRKSSESK